MFKRKTFISVPVNETVGVLIIIAAWGLLSLFYPAYIIPSPLAVVMNWGSILPADFTGHALITLIRVLVGFILAFIAGSLLGGLAYHRKTFKSVNALMMALQVIPGTILGIIFLLMFGLGSITPILLVAFLTVPMMTINTVNGLMKCNQNLRQYLHSIQASRGEVLRYIYFPALVPVLQSNISLGIGMAVKVVVLGEFIGAQNGLGYLLNNARILFNMKEVFSYLLVLMLFMLFCQSVQNLFFSLFLRKYTYPE
jgi:NitT/TauT family transport system permease protein